MLPLDAILRVLLADVSFPRWHPRAGESGPVYAFLIRHPDGAIMVDTGIGPAHASIDSAYRPNRRSLPDALVAAGVSTEDVRVVVNTHLHFDHCGWNHLFPGVPIVVQAAELEDAKSPDYTIAEWVDFQGAEYEPTAEGDAEVAEGVRVVPTPGHTRGHQSIVVETEVGRVIIAGQAAETASEFAASSDESVVRLRAKQPVLVLFSHDDAIWQP